MTKAFSSQLLCRDCFVLTEVQKTYSRCPSCGSPRILIHDELDQLSIAHIDCDAFYATVEKRDNPELADKPVIIGGEKRGVVATCCYIARQYGIHSAMPSFQAKRLCPDAVYVRPNMAKYAEVSKQVKTMMQALTPLVEPLSIDEAFLDMSGTQKVHKQLPAQSLARFAAEIEHEIGITVSIGLSHNKFLAKIGSDLDKPRGFSVIGQAETKEFLAKQHVSIIYGIGKAFQKRLAKDGITHISQLQKIDERILFEKYGSMGARLASLANGKDHRSVKLVQGAKSVSSETTFFEDKKSDEELSKALLDLSEKVAYRLKKKDWVGGTVTLKLKSAGFKTRTRSRQLLEPTQFAHVLYEIGHALLLPELDGTPFRLLGIGVSGIEQAPDYDRIDLIDPSIAKKAALERAMDKAREKFGKDAVIRGKLYDTDKHNQLIDKGDSDESN